MSHVVGGLFAMLASFYFLSQGWAMATHSPFSFNDSHETEGQSQTEQLFDMKSMVAPISAGILSALRRVITRRISLKGYSRTKDLDSEQLLEQLPSLQQLLYRLMGCWPEGAAIGNFVIQYALALVLKESFKIYCGVNDGIINLIDKFFEMPRHEAIKALVIYKRAGQQCSG